MDEQDFAARVGLATVLLFGLFAGASFALFSIGMREAASWLSLPLLPAWGVLWWATRALKDRP